MHVAAAMRTRHRQKRLANFRPEAHQSPSCQHLCSSSRDSAARVGQHCPETRAPRTKILHSRRRMYHHCIREMSWRASTLELYRCPVPPRLTLCICQRVSAPRVNMSAGRTYRIRWLGDGNSGVDRRDRPQKSGHRSLQLPLALPLVPLLHTAHTRYCA